MVILLEHFGRREKTLSPKDTHYGDIYYGDIYYGGIHKKTEGGPEMTM